MPANLRSPKLKVFAYFQMQVIAPNKTAAARVLRDELGTVDSRKLVRAKGPFRVQSGDEILSDDMPESEYVKTVATYAGGIVHDGS